MKEIKHSVNWTVGWIAYRYDKLYAIWYDNVGAVEAKAYKNIKELQKFGEKILEGWM